MALVQYNPRPPPETIPKVLVPCLKMEQPCPHLSVFMVGPGVTVGVVQVKSTNQVDLDLDPSCHPPVTKPWVAFILKDQW